MCGISGFNWEDRVLGGNMNECISHRGPDFKDIYSDGGVTLAHRRLAIIDLSAAANQPMTSDDGNLVMVFNGEIYNYLDLKEELKSKYKFKTQSDSEVIIAGFSVWGNEVFNKLNGIFSLAIWNKKENTLICARDHIGIKPFYYFFEPSIGKFIFSSEIKSILTHNISRHLNLDSFNEYLRVLYVPEPNTMIEGMYKLPPGSYLTLKNGEMKINTFYKPEQKLKKWNYLEAVEKVRNTVVESANRQLIADVPLGIYLSGGIDSSAVLASVSKFRKNIKTFSIGFELEDNEEREKFNRDFELARETAKHFGADHNEVVISSQNVSDTLEEIIGSIDDPISNPTAIPMAHLSKFAKQQVTVVLSGNGGDELFGGYERYRTSFRADTLNRLGPLKLLLPKRIKKVVDSTILERLSIFEFEKDKKLKKAINSKYLKENKEIQYIFERYSTGSNSITEDLMMIDLKSWLPDQALALGDRMSMYGSVEERVPLLDKELVNLAMSLPLNIKVDNFNTKKVLKDAFKKELPDQLFKEPKRGWFSPGAKWLRQPEIEKIARNVLSSEYYSQTKDLFEWNNIEEIFNKHLNREEYNLTLIWMIMTFQIWAKKYKIEIPNG